MIDPLRHFTVAIPSDGGFIGRNCPTTGCGRYFKIHLDSFRDELTCPYCGTATSKNEQLTADQGAYLRRIGTEKAKEFAYGEIDRMMSDLAQRFRGNKHFKFTTRPINYRAKLASPAFREREIDSELSCSQCETRFQVYGIFGYCPGCASEQTLIYDANLAIMRSEILASPEPRRALRHAYTDLVSTFESTCKRHASRLHISTGRFQDLFEARKAFKDALGVDMLSGLVDNDLLTLRRVFQKRHAAGHGGGIVDDKYVRVIPEDRALMGLEVPLTLEEFEEGARLLRAVLLHLAPRA